MAFLKFEDIDKSFGENNVISKFNLEVEKGKFIVLLGPSGCGKSTLLRMIAGLEKIDYGKILLENNLLNNLLPSKRQIAMVFQSYALYPHMNVFENISFGLKSEKISKDQIKEKVTEAAKILKIEDLLNRRPKELSGGQRQRVAIGRAITRNPKLFLFDEPLSNLDAALRSEMRVEISKLHKKLKSNIIYVTHDQIEAMTLADKIVIMNKGNIEQFGTPNDIYNNPKNVFVAEFIGNPKMNIIKIEKEDIVNKNTLNLFNNIIKFENSNFINDIYVGIRPEDISLENKSEIAVEITVELIENLGSEKIIYTYLNDTEIRIKSSKNIKDKNITIYLPRNKLYLFDNNKNRFKT
ncbi:ABC transporter ATP-binding protein [Candidatus Pelagibacter communis]|uniref:ABC transporter ATP-binding protein n=1 Tax=Pelagibacter ubique TaxID=198252 RepID=UPI00094CB22F|nr:ABC transporter ATP-binding protein [Candidatus Pelagibacter ubique]